MRTLNNVDTPLPAFFYNTHVFLGYCKVISKTLGPSNEKDGKQDVSGP